MRRPKLHPLTQPEKNSMTQEQLSDPKFSARYIASLPPAQSKRIINNLTTEQLVALKHSWEFWARAEQLPPTGDWRIWLLLAGRGFGKTRTICEWARAQAKLMPGSRGAIVAATAADARDIVVEGESGILAVHPSDERPVYEPSKRRLTWPNGTMATLFSADEPDRLRGPQFHWAIADELAAWRRPEAWDMLLMGLRLGTNPRAAVATTPRPTKIIKDLVADETVAATRGSTYDNRANLAAAFFAQIINRYEGTRLGRQEITGEILLDNPGALWKRTMIDGNRRTIHPDLRRIVIGVDPPAEGGECGIVTAGVATIDGVEHGYVLSDRTRTGSPKEWGEAVVTAYHTRKADRVIGEVNNGGQMIEHVIRTVPNGLNVSYKSVRATRGKTLRAEPVVGLYEQGRIHHVGSFVELEDQMCEWEPGQPSPDRIDALVWAFTELMVDGYGFKVAGRVQ